jgi:hypothetical protein
MIFAALLLACGGVPDLRFADPDAALDATDETARDADPDVAADALPPADAGFTCPGLVPTFASVCCGAIACLGANCPATCGDCQAKCAPAQLCCPTSSNKAVCRAGQTCN